MRAGWEVGVGHRHEVGGEGGVVGLLETREGERAWDVLARGRVGGRGWLMRVEGAAGVFGRAELVSGGGLLGL